MNNFNPWAAIASAMIFVHVIVVSVDHDLIGRPWHGPIDVHSDSGDEDIGCCCATSNESLYETDCAGFLLPRSDEKSKLRTLIWMLSPKRVVWNSLITNGYLCGAFFSVIQEIAHQLGAFRDTRVDHFLDRVSLGNRGDFSLYLVKLSCAVLGLSWAVMLAILVWIIAGLLRAIYWISLPAWILMRACWRLICRAAAARGGP